MRPGWIRLYPINFRELASDDRFRKYDVVRVQARPARQDPRRESWKPILDTMVAERHLAAWKPRRAWVDPYLEDSMCRLNRDARRTADAQSLALIRPERVDDLEVEPHPGWTPAERRKIDAYVSQLDLFNSDRTPLQAPRFKAFYLYCCGEPGCGGNRQRLIDWELVAFNVGRHTYPRTGSAEPSGDKFLGELCAASRDVAFYVGKQAKRAHVFSVLGVYWPPRR